MKVEDLELEYGFPDTHTALALRNRSLGELSDVSFSVNGMDDR